MKDTYIKPVLYIESFALSQTIARNCGDTHSSTIGESNHYDENTCSWDAGGITIFYDHCDLNVDLDPDTSIEDFLDNLGICYNNPDGGQSIFSSM